MLHVLVSTDRDQALNAGYLKLKTKCTYTEFVIYIYRFCEIAQIIYIYIHTHTYTHIYTYIHT